MKTLITFVSLITFNFLSAQGNYEKGMQKAFELWGNQKNEEAANLFERIALAEKENWIPFYYAAQVITTSTFTSKDRKKIIPNLEKAQDLLNQAKMWTTENTEILVMQAILHTGYVVYDGQTYGPTLSPKIEALYQQAIAIEPKNPRAHLQLTEWKMGSAKFFGKDPSVYCADLDKVVILFNKEKNETPFYPSWGKNRAENIIANCNK